MKVIGAGFGRTGTMSLRSALETLGFGPCYHMEELLHRPSHVRVWKRVVEGRSVDWNALFNGYQSTLDWPACIQYKTLMEHFPDSRVILTVRDPDQWYESCLRTIYPITRSFPMSWGAWLVPIFNRPARTSDRTIWDHTFEGRFLDRDFALQVYRNHLEEVQRVVPPERLLVFEVRKGWEPLCRFLDVPVPRNTPFPQLNDSIHFKYYIKKARVATAGVMLMILTALGALTAGLVVGLSSLGG